MKCFLIFIFAWSMSASAATELRNVVMSDGSIIQVCTRYPASRIVAPKPALMLLMGSGKYDACRAIESHELDAIVDNGTILFTRQKRGIMRDPLTGSLKVDADIYQKVDLNVLKSDAVDSFLALAADRRVDAKQIGIIGGSEGTILSSYIASQAGLVKDVTLISTAVEDFRGLLERQLYEILPRDLIQQFDKDSDRSLSREEISNEFLSNSDLAPFQSIAGVKGFITQSDLVAEIRRVIAASVANGENKFFMSPIGGEVSLAWYKSALQMPSISDELLTLSVPLHFYHGTLDENTLVAPVRALQDRAQVLGKSNFEFTYFEGLQHELTMPIIFNIIKAASERVDAVNPKKGPI